MIVSDTYGNRIRRIDPSGYPLLALLVSFVCCRPRSCCLASILTFFPRFSCLLSLLLAVHISILLTGNVTTIIGDGSRGSVNGTGTAAQCHSPWGLVIEPASGSIIFVDNQVRKEDITRPDRLSSLVVLISACLLALHSLIIHSSSLSSSSCCCLSSPSLFFLLRLSVPRHFVFACLFATLLFQNHRVRQVTPQGWSSYLMPRLLHVLFWFLPASVFFGCSVIQIVPIGFAPFVDL